MTLFNEMCQAVKRFDEVKMNQLAMVAEFTGFNDFADVTYIANHLGEFEINPFVHNDEEYGKFLVTEQDCLMWMNCCFPISIMHAENLTLSVVGQRKTKVI